MLKTGGLDCGLVYMVKPLIEFAGVARLNNKADGHVRFPL
jgi:hypothetical protein